MRNNLIKVAAAVPELKIGDITYNTEKIIEVIVEHSDSGLIVFPELSLTGYTCADLFQSDLLLNEAQASLVSIAEHTKELKLTAVVGLPVRFENCIYNCGAVISGGRVKAVIPKSYLPNYSEFYECRWFSPGKGITGKVIRLGDEEIPFGTDIIAEDPVTEAVLGAEICEDLWVPDKPSTHA
ncbi:MAG: NAD(+) synthase, partial [Lachnospiraceae bacterium]|nr:NAD(+) synthase [Lachnospiraceae bacterium]